MRHTTVMATGLVSAILLAACSQAATVPVPAKRESTPTAAPAPTATATPGLVLLDISGSDSHQSNTFTAPNSWDVIWEAEPAPRTIGSFISVNLVDAKGNPVDTVFTAHLDPPESKKNDVIHMHRAGTFYLDIAGVSIWHIKAVTT